MKTLNETKLDMSKVYFHGSSEARVHKLEAPSYEHPFYATPDLHYAMAFCTKDSSCTGEWGIKKSFTPSSQNYVYVVTLKPGCRVFDFRDHSSSEFKKIYKIIDPMLIDWIEKTNAMQFDLGDVYEFTAALETSVIKPVDVSNANYMEYSKIYTKEKDQMTPALFLKACSFVKKNGLYGASRDKDIHQVMVPLLKALNKLGFHGVLTREYDFNDEPDGASSKVTTDYAVGVFDVKGLDLIGLVPMKYAWLKKVNPKYLEDQTSSSAYQKVKRFIQLYRAISKRHTGDK